MLAVPIAAPVAVAATGARTAPAIGTNAAEYAACAMAACVNEAANYPTAVAALA